MKIEMPPRVVDHDLGFFLCLGGQLDGQRHVSTRAPEVWVEGPDRVMATYTLGKIAVKDRHTNTVHCMEIAYWTQDDLDAAVDRINTVLHAFRAIGWIR